MIPWLMVIVGLIGLAVCAWFIAGWFPERDK